MDHINPRRALRAARDAPNAAALAAGPECHGTCHVVRRRRRQIPDMLIPIPADLDGDGFVC